MENETDTDGERDSVVDTVVDVDIDGDEVAVFTKAIEGVDEVDTEPLNEVVGEFEEVPELDTEFERLWDNVTVKVGVTVAQVV